MDRDDRKGADRSPATCRETTIAGLRARIAAIERGGTAGRRTVSLGLAALDAALPEGGLARGAVHEIAGSAAGGFATLAAGRCGGTVLWCVDGSARAALYGPGLVGFGLPPARVVVVRCRDRTELLWAMEEGLRTQALAAVVGEPPGTVDLTASRRLQLAAETGGGLGIVLHPNRAGRFAASALESRWRVEAAPGRDVLRPRWMVTLARCRGGAQGSNWIVERHEKTGDFAVVAEAADRPAAAAIA